MKDKVINDLLSRISTLEYEVERLDNIIDKAKEFIYENAYDTERAMLVDELYYEIPELLEILDKEKDNER